MYQKRFSTNPVINVAESMPASSFTSRPWTMCSTSIRSQESVTYFVCINSYNQCWFTLSISNCSHYGRHMGPLLRHVVRVPRRDPRPPLAHGAHLRATLRRRRRGRTHGQEQDAAITLNGESRFRVGWVEQHSHRTELQSSK